jgi:hypothetical protein
MPAAADEVDAPSSVPHDAWARVLTDDAPEGLLDRM